MTRRCTLSPEGAARAAADRLAASIPVIGTDRLTLRAPRIEDLPHWTDLLVPDDKGHLGGPHTEEQAWEAFSVYVAGWTLHGHGLWTAARRDDGRVLGFVLLGLEWEDREPELGWMFLPEHRGQGYAVEAAKAARDQGTALFGAGGFVSYVEPDNDRSNRLAERLGATRDADAEAEIGDGTHVWRHGARA